MIDRQQESLQSGDLTAMHKVTRSMTQGPGSNRRSAFRVGGGPEVSSNHNLDDDEALRVAAEGIYVAKTENKKVAGWSIHSRT